MFPELGDLINGIFGTHLRIPVYTYGFFLLMAFTAGFFVIFAEAKRRALLGQIPAKSPSYIFEVTIMVIVAGVIGIKVFHILEHWGDFIRDPVRMLFKMSGFSFYGGLILVSICIIIYVRIKRIPLLYSADIAAPAILLAYSVGRLGCHLSGDGCWGIVNPYAKPGFLPDWLWSSSYPHNILNAGIPIPGCSGNHCFALADPVFPTSLYESLAAFLFFLVLWILRKRIGKEGFLFVLFLLFMSITRFAVESIRNNPRFGVSGFRVTQAELISIFLFIVGIFIFYYPD